MQKELSEVAEMQRSRLRKVIDPFRSILSVEHIGYRQYISDRISLHGEYTRDAKIVRHNLPWLIASSVPLAYLTKSLWLPLAYLNVTLYGRLYYRLNKTDCFFCQYSSLRTLKPVL